MEKIDRSDADQPLAPFMHHDRHLTHESRVDGYMALELVLLAAYEQAAGGKGAERHADDDPFLDQPIMSIGRLLKSADGEAYQVIKKLREGLFMARRGKPEAAIREFLGAINYVAAVALIVAEQGHFVEQAPMVKSLAQKRKKRGSDQVKYQATALVPNNDAIREMIAEDAKRSGVVPLSDAIKMTEPSEEQIIAAVTGAIFDETMNEKNPDFEATAVKRKLPRRTAFKPGPDGEINIIDPPKPGVVPDKDQFTYAIMCYGPDDEEVRNKFGHMAITDNMEPHAAAFHIRLAMVNAAVKYVNSLAGTGVCPGAVACIDAINAWRGSSGMFDAMKGGE